MCSTTLPQANSKTTCIQDLELRKSLQRKRLRLVYHLVHAQTAHLRRSVLCWKAARRQEQAEKDQSVMLAAENRGLPWSLRCVDLLDFANPPSPLMFPESVRRGRPSLEDRRGQTSPMLGFKRPEETEIVLRGIKVATLLFVLPLSWRTPQFADSPLDGVVSLFQYQRQLVVISFKQRSSI